MVKQKPPVTRRAHPRRLTSARTTNRDSHAGEGREEFHTPCEPPLKIHARILYGLYRQQTTKKKEEKTGNLRSHTSIFINTTNGKSTPGDLH